VRTEQLLIGYLKALAAHRLAAARDGERGYSTEAVIVTALLVAGAIVVVGIIVAKVRAAATGIKTH
jgi:hypothetical protein